MKYQLVVRTQSGIEKELRNRKDNLLTVESAEDGFLNQESIARMIQRGDFCRFDLGDTTTVEEV